MPLDKDITENNYMIHPVMTDGWNRQHADHRIGWQKGVSEIDRTLVRKHAPPDERIRS